VIAIREKASHRDGIVSKGPTRPVGKKSQKQKSVRPKSHAEKAQGRVWQVENYIKKEETAGGLQSIWGVHHDHSVSPRGIQRGVEDGSFER